MPFDTIYLVYAALFVGAIFLAEGVYYLIVDSKEHSKANRRMNMLASGKDASEVFEALRRKPLRRIPYLGPLGIPLVHLESTLAKSGLSVSLGRFLLFMAAVTVVSVVVLILMLQRSALPNVLATNAACIVLALLIGVGMPLLVVAQMKSSRLKRFGEQLPDTLDVMVRSLHAGHPIASALKLVTEEMPDPVGTEFGIAVDEMTYGLELRHSLENMAERIGQSDFKYVVVAINIQHETGGNLAEVLSNLSSIIRERFRMFQKIKAMSAEGRMSAWVLSALPIVVLLMLSILNPAYYTAVMDDPLFWPVSGIALGLMTFAIYIMYRMVNFRV
jgi:tight adherence protein B